jgi:hypothetical protein
MNSPTLVLPAITAPETRTSMAGCEIWLAKQETDFCNSGNSQ